MSKRTKEELACLRSELLVSRVGFVRSEMGRRLSETKKIFGSKVWAVDIHTHSSFSDGCGTVEQNYLTAKTAGMDFMFATDHASLGQKRRVKRWPDTSWGQEPGVGGHHLGLLEGTRLFRPKPEAFSLQYSTACKIAPFVWVPHPVGWYPSTWYDDERISQLWNIGDSFAVEVMNGANKICHAYDEFDRKAVEVWDRLLCDGKRVTALAGSDAHLPDQVGTVWTGVYTKRLTGPSIIRALNRGLCFASEASLLDFHCGTEPMGSRVRKRRGSRIELSFRVADAAGIASVRIVAAGKVVKEIAGKNRNLVTGSVQRTAGARPTYYRIESTASDGRRAFSTPIYVDMI